MIVTKFNITDKHKETMDSVYATNYYTSIFNKLKEFYPNIENETDFRQIVNFWDDFWNQLPDTKEIRRFPFFDICDIAENIFVMDDEE